MTPNASPKRHEPPRPRFRRPLGVGIALVLAAGLLAAYQLEVRVGRPPEFGTGGDFLDTFPVPGQDGRPYPYGDASASTSPSTAPGASTSTPATRPATFSASPTATSDASTTTAPSTTGSTSSPAPAATDAADPPLPGLGTYTYAVSGSEAATGFGSRSLPSSATVVVHRGGTLQPDQVVLDLTLSDQHRERAILGHRAGGVTFDYEAGSITFGPGTQSSEGTYDPPMVQVPWPLAEGAAASGSSATSTRVEQWTATVVGREVLDVLGGPRETWVVDLQRTTPAGSAEEVDRYRRYWYDPTLGTWVQWYERFHGARDMLFTFTYDAEYTATLTSYTPG